MQSYDDLLTLFTAELVLHEPWYSKAGLSSQLYRDVCNIPEKSDVEAALHPHADGRLRIVKIPQVPWLHVVVEVGPQYVQPWDSGAQF